MVARYEGAHTYSRLSDFDCALKFKLKHVEKRSEPANPAFVKGARVHEGLDLFVKGRSKVLPEEAMPLKKEIQAVARIKHLRGEESWGFDRAWKPLPVTGYFSNQDYIRCKIDALHIDGTEATVIDWKTGQIRSASPEQVRFYGMLTLIREPKVEKVNLKLFFVERGKVSPHNPVHRGELMAIRLEYQKKFKAIEDERQWKPNPGKACQFCPFTRHRGGPCKY